MAGTPSTSAGAAEEEDSEWEYEYDETETEVNKSAPNATFVADGNHQSFYVTLDISSAADYNKLGTKKKNPDPSQPKVPQPTTMLGAQDNASLSEPPETPVPEPGARDDADPLEPPEVPIAETPVPMDIDPNLEQPEEDPPFPEPEDRIQILDLHTHNPLISYKNQFYSCEWTSTLGTDVILTAPIPDFPHPVLREQPNVSVLAVSSIKLMGRPAQIASRHSAEEDGQKETPAPENSAPSANTASPEKATPVKIPLGPTPSRARQNQANFLERLMAIKAKKGEKDNVTIYTQKVNQGTGWRSQRKASEAFEEGEDETVPKQSRRGNGTGGRPRGSRRRGGPRTAKGGLFRDYRPQLWDTPGADIRAGPLSTPESWDQIEGGASDGVQTPTSATARASPLPANQTAPTAERRNSPVPASAGANASPTPSVSPLRSPNRESLYSSGQVNPSPSLALSLGLQTAPVTNESVEPASQIPDAGSLHQSRVESSMTERSTPAPDLANDILESSITTAAGDVEMEDIQ